MIPDPPVTERCAQCRRRRRPDQARAYRLYAEVDPFCSMPCARRFHGAEIVPNPVWGNGTSGLGAGVRSKAKTLPPELTLCPLGLGNKSGYGKGCRCGDCRDAASRARADRRRRAAA